MRFSFIPRKKGKTLLKGDAALLAEKLMSKTNLTLNSFWLAYCSESSIKYAFSYCQMKYKIKRCNDLQQHIMPLGANTVLAKPDSLKVHISTPPL